MSSIRIPRLPALRRGGRHPASTTRSADTACGDQAKRQGSPHAPVLHADALGLRRLDLSGQPARLALSSDQLAALACAAHRRGYTIMTFALQDSCAQPYDDDDADYIDQTLKAVVRDQGCSATGRRLIHELLRLLGLEIAEVQILSPRTGMRASINRTAYRTRTWEGHEQVQALLRAELDAVLVPAGLH